MPPGRPHLTPLVVRSEDREDLLRWTRRSKSSNGLAQRARFILRCADGMTSTKVARELRVTNQTVGKMKTDPGEASTVAPATSKAPSASMSCSTHEHPKPFAWLKTPDEMLASVARVCL
jgi:hypothetical protein